MNATYAACRLLPRANLAPDIIEIILEGAGPADLTVRELTTAKLPLDWPVQRRLLGFLE